MIPKRPSSRDVPSSDNGQSAQTPHHPELEWREVVHGNRPGDVYVRVARHKAFKKVAPGTLEIREGAIPQPRGGFARARGWLKRTLVGAPLATAAATHERLTKIKALAVLSSDAVSSSAYATDEILLVVVLAG